MKFIDIRFDIGWLILVRIPVDAEHGYCISIHPILQLCFKNTKSCPTPVQIYPVFFHIHKPPLLHFLRPKPVDQGSVFSFRHFPVERRFCSSIGHKGDRTILAFYDTFQLPGLFVYSILLPCQPIFFGFLQYFRCTFRTIRMWTEHFFRLASFRTGRLFHVGKLFKCAG